MDIMSLKGKVIFSCEVPSTLDVVQGFKYVVEQAVKQRVSLAYADLRDKDLSGTNLAFGDFKYANLSRSIFDGADMSNTNLFWASINKSSMVGTNLILAYTRGALFRNSDLSYADLSFANFQGAFLKLTKLDGANFKGTNVWQSRLPDGGLQNCVNAPKIVKLHDFTIYVNGIGDMRIGCQCHSIKAWKKFTNEELSKMSPNAIWFKGKYGEEILKLCESYKV